MFQLTRDEEEQERPAALVWDGTEQRAKEIVDWARDEALLLFAQAIKPRPGAGPNDPDGVWRVQVKVPVPSYLGGGDTWREVPLDASIRNTGTWIDPVFKIEPAVPKQTPAAVAAGFQQPPQE